MARENNTHSYAKFQGCKYKSKLNCIAEMPLANLADIFFIVFLIEFLYSCYKTQLGDLKYIGHFLKFFFVIWDFSKIRVYAGEEHSY